MKLDTSYVRLLQVLNMVCTFLVMLHQLTQVTDYT